jgi:hypothetical protein
MNIQDIPVKCPRDRNRLSCFVGKVGALDEPIARFGSGLLGGLSDEAEQFVGEEGTQDDRVIEGQSYRG